MAETTTLEPVPAAPAHTPSYSRLTRSDIGLVYKLHKDGLTQVQIAQRLGCHQATVSKWLKEFEDTTDQSKAYLRGQALKMSQDIVKKGKPSDKVAVLKGLSVLHEEQHAGVTVIVGGAGTVNIGVVSPPRIEASSEGERNS